MAVHNPSVQFPDWNHGAGPFRESYSRQYLFSLTPSRQVANLRKGGGLSFLAVYRGGNFPEVTATDDPIFGAHTPRYNSVSRISDYCVDHEATALGCLE